MTTLNELYARRNYLIEVENRCIIDDIEVMDIERKISELEYLPSFEEVVNMLSDGRMKSIF